MARALRILLAGGWYQIAARSNNRAELFRDDRDRRRFLALLAELPGRFAIEIHAFVLMDTHYHLLVRTREANLSHGLRWLNVAYSLGFNARHRQVGHVFQGRFKAIILQDERWVGEVARYLHLNPVRTSGGGLGRAGGRGPRASAAEDTNPAVVTAGLAILQTYAWSSWRSYTGVQPAPAWLDTSVVARPAGGRPRRTQPDALREYTERPIREGYLESPWDRLVGGLVLGEANFAQRLLRGCTLDLDEHTAARRLQRRVAWDRIVHATEIERGSRWDELLGRYGDWSRDAALYFAVRHGGHRLAEVVRTIPGLRYMAAAQGVKRFARALATDAQRQKFIDRLRRCFSET